MSKCYSNKCTKLNGFIVDRHIDIVMLKCYTNYILKKKWINVAWRVTSGSIVPENDVTEFPMYVHI